jgi:hypothetical protein
VKIELKKIKKCHQKVTTDWNTEQRKTADSSNDDNSVASEKKPNLQGPSSDPPGRLGGIY